jgi:hypothetical protein
MNEQASDTTKNAASLTGDASLLPHAIGSDQTLEMEDHTEIGSFVDFNRVLLSILTDLQKLGGFARELDLTETATLIAEMRRRLTERRFNIAVVGEFKRGKSTFINALLGADALPSDVLPCSATLNRVTYGLKEAVRIEHHDGRVVDIPFGELSDYVTKLTPESEQRAATIKQAVVYYPTPYCANNVDVIDTPGLNDDQAMTGVTLSVLPQTDAAILVIMAQAPFSEYERDFLESKLLTADLGRVLFVVNGIDLFRRPEDADRVVRHVEERIKGYVLDRAAAQYGEDSDEYRMYVRKIGRPRIFGLSAMKALQAKLSGNQRMMADSHFDVFERELERFLTEKRGAITLQAPLSRLVAGAREIEHAISLQEGALRLAHDDFDKGQKESIASIETLRTRKRTELEEINRKAQQVRQEILPLLASLPNEIIAAAERTVDDVRIEAKELDDIQKLQDRIGRLVARETRRAADVGAEHIAAIVDRAVAEEAARLGDFARLVDELPTALADNFKVIQSEVELAHGTSRQAAAAAAIALFTGFGGIYTGYRDAGFKGAAIGAVTSVGTAFLGTVILSLFALPISPIALIVLGVASMLPTRWAVRGAFGGQRIDRFRSRYRDALLDKLRDQLHGIDLRATVADQILGAFANLRDQVEREAEAVLRDAETQLANLRASYERQSTLEEGRHRELEEIRGETRRITESAARLSRQLVEAMEI